MHARSDFLKAQMTTKRKLRSRSLISVVRASLVVDLVGYIFIGIVTSQAPFMGATIVLAFGRGFDPFVQSLASPSTHIARREARAYGSSLPSNAKQKIG
ncbi:hypothetical protein B0J17DRAFT_652646 [Rhizoctonia solani]|nr:hypothetical protein B0J17DRAFT_652646 [Rhizoctonia solani]